MCDSLSKDCCTAELRPNNQWPALRRVNIRAAPWPTAKGQTVTQLTAREFEDKRAAIIGWLFSAANMMANNDTHAKEHLIERMRVALLLDNATSTLREILQDDKPYLTD